LLGKHLVHAVAGVERVGRAVDYPKNSSSYSALALEK